MAAFSAFFFLGGIRGASWLKFLLSFTLVMCALLLLYSIAEEDYYIREAPPADSVRFEGAWRVPGGPDHPLTPETSLDPRKFAALELEGHLSRVVLAGERLLLRSAGLRVTVWVNGKKIYTHAEPGTFSRLMRSPGHGWLVIAMPMTTPQDSVRLEISTIYLRNHPSVYDRLLREMYVGDSGALLRHLLVGSAYHLLMGTVVLLMGFFALATAITLAALRTPLGPAPWHFAFFSLATGVWLLLDFDTLPLLLPYWGTLDVLNMLCVMLAVPLCGLYLRNFLSSTGARAVMTLVVALLLGFTMGYIVVQGLGMYDSADMLRGFLPLGLVAFIIYMGCLGYEALRIRGKGALFLLFSSLVWLLCLADMVRYFVTDKPGIVLSVTGIGLFMLGQFLYMTHYLKRSYEGLRKVHELESSLENSKLALALGQIQPHFLFNTLAGIKQLCNEAPARAEAAVGDIAAFLRGYMHSLTSAEPIPLERELEHVRHFIALEELRYGPRLQVVYDLRVTDFTVPPLSLQPLVENAVRHGVMQRGQGGTVTVSSAEVGDFYTVTVRDDGVGFDPALAREAGHALDNVRQRLRLQCGGDLRLQSAPGKGAAVTMIIPKESVHARVDSGR